MHVSTPTPLLKKKKSQKAGKMKFRQKIIYPYHFYPHQGTTLKHTLIHATDYKVTRLQHF